MARESENVVCPHCGNADPSLIEEVAFRKGKSMYLCGQCTRRFQMEWVPADKEPGYGHEV